jgi:hypothetical protein
LREAAELSSIRKSGTSVILTGGRFNELLGQRETDKRLLLFRFKLASWKSDPICMLFF